MTLPLQSAAPVSGTLLWWVAFIGVSAPVFGIFWKIVTTGTRIVRSATKVELAVESLTASVQTLTLSDAARTQSLHDAMQDIRNLATAISSVASVNGKRYEVLKETVEDHGERITKIEAVPLVKRALK